MIMLAVPELLVLLTISALVGMAVGFMACCFIAVAAHK